MLTEFQREKLPRVFALYDADNNGFIEQSDFERLLQTLAQARNWEPGTPEYDVLEEKLMSRWDNIRKSADVNRDGRVSLDEWLANIDHMLQFETEAKAITGSIFGVFDRDGDDKLDVEEYKELYRAIGLDESFAADYFQGLDLNDDGYISRDEFVTLAQQFFRSNDRQAAGNLLFGPGR